MAFSLFLTLPLSASAGMLSFVSSLLFGSTASAERSEGTQNLQSMALLRGAINFDPNTAKGGGDITVMDGALFPETGPSGTVVGKEEPKSDQISIYVVRGGDTLSEIAETFDVSVNTIRWANDLGASGTIRPGQTLVILPISGVRHTVKAGDTLKSIAKKYDGDLDEIVSYNGIAAEAALSVGDVIVVPHGEVSAPAATAAARGGGPSISGYFIKPVDGIRTQGLHGYNGIDLGAPVGTPIIAAAQGDVIRVCPSTSIDDCPGTWNGGYGNYIVIRHGNGTQTLYAHNNQNIVFVGDSVVQGQVIGYVGSTGRSTGPHLHFEVRGAANPFAR